MPFGDADRGPASGASGPTAASAPSNARPCREFLAESAVAETNFVQALEDFCGSDEDPVAVAVGGT